jgi:hypothetical protein
MKSRNTGARLLLPRWWFGLLAATFSACGESSAPASPSGASVTSVTVTLVAIAPGYQATAVAAFADGSSREVTSDAQWSSSNSSVATVSATGQVSLIAGGSTEIRATYQTVSGGAMLAVTQPLPPSSSSQSSYRFAGVILDGLDGEPVARVRVDIESSDGSIVTWVWSDSRGGYDIGASSASRTATVTIRASFPGYAAQRVERIVSAGAVTVDFSLTPVPFTLTGYVTDRDRDVPACEPIKLEALDGPSPGQFILVPRQPGSGAYRFENLQPGTYTLRASAPGYHMQDKTARLRGYDWYNRLDFLLPEGSRAPNGNRVDCSLPPLPPLP